MAEVQEMPADDMTALLIIRQHSRYVAERGETVDENTRAGDGGAEIIRLAVIHRGEDHALDAAAAEGAENGGKPAGAVLGVADNERDAALGERILGAPDD